MARPRYPSIRRIGSCHQTQSSRNISQSPAGEPQRQNPWSHSGLHGRMMYDNPFLSANPEDHLSYLKHTERSHMAVPVQEMKQVLMAWHQLTSCRWQRNFQRSAIPASANPEMGCSPGNFHYPDGDSDSLNAPG